MDKTKDFGNSVVRTILLPAIVLFGARLGLDLTEVGTDLAWVISAIGSYVSYVVVRFLEVYASPKWGYILGLPSAPRYVKE